MLMKMGVHGIFGHVYKLIIDLDAYMTLDYYIRMSKRLCITDI